jgi:Trk K+ transport system NAD-binding subunit
MNTTSGATEMWQSHIIICGINNLSMRITELALKAGLEVVVVDDESDRRAEQQIRRLGVTVIHEDSRSIEALEQASIYTASAVIANESSDLHNLEIMLVANQLVEGIRVVTNFFNEDDSIRKQIEGIVPNARVLSLAETSAPSFVDACVPSSIIKLLNIGGEEFAVTEAYAEEQAELAHWLDEIVPIATFKALPRTAKSKEINRPKIEDWTVLPEYHHEVKTGDRVVVAGQLDKLKHTSGVNIREKDIENARETLYQSDSLDLKMKKQKRRRLTKLRRLPSTIKAVFQDFDEPMRRVLITVLILIIASSIFLRFFFNAEAYKDLNGNTLRWDFIEAFYFTVTLVTTTGFGDYNFLYQNESLKMFGVFMMFFGAVTMAILYAYVTNYVISQRLNQALGRQNIRYMSDHIILCGLGSVGLKVLEGLISRNQQVVVVERFPDNPFVPQARRMGVQVIFADARLKETLRSLNIGQASCIAAMTNDDFVNLELALNAQRLHQEFSKDSHKGLKIVLRLFDTKLAEKIRRNFGISHVRSAASLAAPHFIGAAFNYEVLGTFYVKEELFGITEVLVRNMHNITIGELYQKTKMRVLAHLPKTLIINAKNSELPLLARPEYELKNLSPNTKFKDDFCLCEGDRVYLVGTYDQMLKVRQLNG